MLGDGTNITRQYTECVWEKDTDQMVWWPPEIKPCDGQFKYLQYITNHVVTSTNILPSTLKLATIRRSTGQLS